MTGQALCVDFSNEPLGYTVYKQGKVREGQELANARDQRLADSHNCFFRAQDAPRRTQDAAKLSQDSPKDSQDEPVTPQESAQRNHRYLVHINMEYAISHI